MEKEFKPVVINQPKSARELLNNAIDKINSLIEERETIVKSPYLEYLSGLVQDKLIEILNTNITEDYLDKLEDNFSYSDIIRLSDKCIIEFTESYKEICGNEFMEYIFEVIQKYKNNISLCEILNNIISELESLYEGLEFTLSIKCVNTKIERVFDPDDVFDDDDKKIQYFSISETLPSTNNTLAALLFFDGIKDHPISNQYSYKLVLIINQK